jgi:hypothetical protein
MRRTVAGVVVAAVLIAGCGGGSDSDNGGSDSSEPSAGDTQYIDPFQKGACLSKGEIQQKIFRIASEIHNPKHKQKAIRAVRQRAC